MYQKLLSRDSTPGVKSSKITKAAQGYGMALLLVFCASSILVAASTSLLLAPGTSNAVGSLSLDEATAKQIAEKALDEAKTDILSQQSLGTTITTSYRYPSSGSRFL